MIYLVCSLSSLRPNILLTISVEFDVSLTTELHESFKHEKAFTDGEIFRNIRIYALKRDKKSEKKWWARLSPTKQKDLKQLLGNEKIETAFDNLIEFAGLWPPIQLGQLHRFHGLKCYKVMSCFRNISQENER